MTLKCHRFYPLLHPLLMGYFDKPMQSHIEPIMISIFDLHLLSITPLIRIVANKNVCNLHKVYLSNFGKSTLKKNSHLSIQPHTTNGTIEQMKHRSITLNRQAPLHHYHMLKLSASCHAARRWYTIPGLELERGLFLKKNIRNLYLTDWAKEAAVCSWKTTTLSLRKHY